MHHWFPSTFVNIDPAAFSLPEILDVFFTQGARHSIIIFFASSKDIFLSMLSTIGTYKSYKRNSSKFKAFYVSLNIYPLSLDYQQLYQLICHRLQDLLYLHLGMLTGKN